MSESFLTDDYWTLSGPGTAHTRVLGSRFSALALHISNDADLESKLAELKKSQYDATHHCWALSKRSDGEFVERVNDDGEPKGTAGVPILHEIHRAGVENTAVIVARWFGGTKLGTGGLVRAYGECAALALQAATRVQRKTGTTVSVLAPYDLQSVVYQLAAHSFAPVELQDVNGQARLIIKLRRNQVEPFRLALRDRSGGKLTAQDEGEWTS